MKAQITVNMDNQAFQHRHRAELSSILERLSKTLFYGDIGTLVKGTKYPLHDSNGNRVGYFEVKQGSYKLEPK